MTVRRRRDGETNPVDGAQAVGSGSIDDQNGPEPDAGSGSGAARIQGAWTTPAVVVRRPDGTVLGDGDGDGDGDADSGDRSDRGDPRRSAATAAPRRPRVRPRRVPGAPGAVLYATTLSDAASDLQVTRRRRFPTSTETARTTAAPLPSPAPPPSPASRANGPARPAAPSRPSLRAVGGTSRPASSEASAPRAGTAPVRRGRSGGRNARGPSPSRPGQQRPQRVLRALSGLNFDRLLPADDDARARRAARLRRLAMRLASAATVVVVIYGVFPVRTWIDQQAATDRARERLEVFERENELLAEEARDLMRDERIEEEARAMGMVQEGEESYGIMPAPEAPAAETPARGEASTTEPTG